MEKEEQLLYNLAGKPLAEEIVKINDHFFMIRGFGSSNAYIYIGLSSCIMIDTLSNDAAAKRAKILLDKLTDKPINTIIYTHFSHADHTGGAQVFANEQTTIIAASSQSDTYGHTELLNDILKTRLLQQMGAFLTPEEALSAGLSPLCKNEGAHKPLTPNKWIFSTNQELEIDGVKLCLYKAPGETNDQMYIWFPKDKILCCGDNYYRSWPNLSAPRGSQYRDISQWINSLQIIIDLNPEYLASGHSNIIIGRDNIINEISPYKEAIQYVLLETLKSINQGLTVEEIIETIKLPEQYGTLPQLQELYGTIPWTIRGIFSGYLGWFNGNPTTLFTMSPKQKAQKRIALAGGSNKVLAEIQTALYQKEYQWVLELCDDLIYAEGGNCNAAKEAKIIALEALAHHQTSANGRHIYLSAAKDLKKN